MGKKAKAREKARRSAAVDTDAATDVVAFGTSPRPGVAAPDLERLATRLNLVAIHLLRRLSREDASVGLTSARLSALSVLATSGPRTLGALARTERVTAPSMTRLITALESDGLVERIPSAQDGRKVFVRITAAGTAVMQAGRDRRIEALRTWLGPVGPDGLRCLDDASVLLDSLLRDETP
jgi:DNA-binding MarR family transcriptional regulator